MISIAANVAQERSTRSCVFHKVSFQHRSCLKVPAAICIPSPQTHDTFVIHLHLGHYQQLTACWVSGHKVAGKAV